MLQFLVLSLLLASAAGVAYSPNMRYSAASPAQIRFAYENNFDSTGPGAKQRDNAYQVYNNLDDALIAYIDDPNTILPDNEKARAIANLYRKNSYKIHNPLGSQYRKHWPFMPNNYHNSERNDLSHLKHEIPPPTYHSSNSAPKHYSRGGFRNQYNQIIYQYKPHPDVEFSVDVHDKETGDVKNVRELQDGSGPIHGYYIRD